MYAVVGCSDCSMLWVVEGDPERTKCPRCGTSKAHAKRKEFVTTEDREHAAEVRASMLANRSGHGEAFADLDSYAAMGERADDDVVSDDEYLESGGVDADAARAANERAGSSGGSVSRQDRVKEAVRELDEPTADAVAAYCAEHGVSEAYVREALERLARRGEASESRGVYRLL
ncbi:putative nucleic acid-binding Zn-ribbon protein [Halarchaeum rubridurum]|uniref:Putative nucleic acid-binding Zn-ribbon protein n=1 Tax=Halarchaeum rubridurum TaxID=489911 RepID=A0A830FJE7_9EURY|nr:DUF5817 domain-containing protein [Halarchaeum rubridurum]MBP1953995.1 putative nucleic acid-binding Zn-ribbon protein [Halarchaeum rubridurum]GGM56514.1 hypothetical protein GCM10009017_03340 [Halarchaeum rubridurum]